MTSLASFQSKLESRSNILQSAFERLVGGRPQLRKTDRFAIQEGLVSNLWQSWSSFSRSVVLWSLKGATSASGTAITSPYAANTFDEIRFIAMKVARKQTIGTVGSIAGDHLEPSWGDLRKINLVISRLSPTNSAQLLTAFGSAMIISDLQIVRNACAHISQDRLKDIRSLQVRYSRTSYSHPSDALFWVDPASGDFSFNAWLDEMRLVASAAVA